MAETKHDDTSRLQPLGRRKHAQNHGCLSLGLHDLPDVDGEQAVYM